MLHLHRNWINTEVYVTLNRVKTRKVFIWVPFHTTPEEFENGSFTLKTYQMSLDHTALEKFENAPISGHFGFVSEDIIYRKVVVFKVFSVRTKTQSRRFQIPPVWKAVSKSSVIRLVWTKDPFSSPETTILLACGRDRGLWSSPTPEVWQIWLV